MGRLYISGVLFTDFLLRLNKYMQKDIHPKYNTAAKIVCACGNTIDTGSTMDEIKTDLCSACHPFYTGKQKLVDTARRVEKFKTKLGSKAKEGTVSKKEKRARIAAEKAAITEASEKEAAEKLKKAGSKKTTKKDEK